MEREEKCKLAIDKGYTYNPETGDITGIKGKVITKKHNGYITIQLYLDKKGYQLRGHQLAWYITYGEVVDCIDHINGLKDDNRISNLRSVTNQENHFNETKAKGYYWCKSKNKWRAKITLNGKNIYLGSYKIEDEARAAYLKAKEKYHKIEKV